MQTKPIGTTFASATKPPESSQKAELKRACQQFESLFVLQLWRAMQRTLPTQPQTLNYAEMFDLPFADYLSQHGRFGLAEQLYRQLESSLPSGLHGETSLENPSTPSPFSPEKGEGELIFPPLFLGEGGLGRVRAEQGDSQ